MNSYKRRRRLVTKRRYIAILANRLLLYALACVAISAGMACFLYTLREAIRTSPDAADLDSFLAELAIGVLAAGLLWCGSRLFKKGRTIAPVVPITERNAHHLPLKQTLVRSSDLPQAERPAELLRATQSGEETPSEQLLRTMESGSPQP